MSACTHTEAEHELMKAPGTWELLELIGFQPSSSWDDIPDLEMRNAACQSTLCRPCHLTEQEREIARAANRRNHEQKRAAIASELEGART